MIVLAGIRTEDPLRRVADELDQIRSPYVVFHQRDFDQTRLEVTLTGGRVGGTLELGGRVVRLEDVQGVYFRLMDDRLLPELTDEPMDSERRRHCRALHETFLRWTEITPARVVNRLSAMGSNSSKPYQAQEILRAGFETPPTLVTNDPERVLRFRERHGRVIYKSVSGIRSIVKELDDESMERLDRIRWCPTQFQAYVEGQDVRVHTLGHHVFATAIHTTGTDYRYAHKEEGGSTELRTVELPPSLSERALTLASNMGLDFAGIDLKLSPDGRVYCFEVNPCPAYSYYESHTGQPMARALAEYLSG